MGESGGEIGSGTPNCRFCGARLVFHSQTSCQECGRDLTEPDVAPQSAGAAPQPIVPTAAAPSAPAVEPAPPFAGPTLADQPAPAREPVAAPTHRRGLFGLLDQMHEADARLREMEKARATAPEETDADGAQDDADDGTADAAEPEDPAARERSAALDAELQRQAEEFGLTGPDPIELFGPHGREVADLLETLAGVDDDAANAIAEAREEITAEERSAAQSIVAQNRRQGDRTSQLRSAERAVSDWLKGLDSETVDRFLYSVVADVATDAVDALVLQDELNDDDFDALYSPWANAMEPPEDGADASDAADAAPDGEFGPNTDVVEAFLARLAVLTEAETTALVGAWQVQPEGDLSAAHRNLQALADEKPEWHDQLKKAQDEVLAWGAGTNAKRHYAADGPYAIAVVRQPAGPVVADAISALCVADLLEESDAEVLYAPWAKVIGKPELPRYE